MYSDHAVDFFFLSFESEFMCPLCTKERKGKFSNLLPKHASTVINIMNLNTGTITPQFQVFYDKFLQKFSSSKDNITKFWGKIVESGKS